MIVVVVVLVAFGIGVGLLLLMGDELFLGLERTVLEREVVRLLHVERLQVVAVAAHMMVAVRAGGVVRRVLAAETGDAYRAVGQVAAVTDPVGIYRAVVVALSTSVVVLHLLVVRIRFAQVVVSVAAGGRGDFVGLLLLLLLLRIVRMMWMMQMRWMHFEK